MTQPRPAAPCPPKQGRDDTDTGPLLSVQDLRVYFRTKRGVAFAVDGVSFTIRHGETLGLVGETGCGKSVTARAMLRLVPEPPGIYAGGQVLFQPTSTCAACGAAGCGECDGSGRAHLPCPSCRGTGCGACGDSGRETVDLLKVPDARMQGIRGNHIAMVFQDPDKALNPSMTVRRQVSEVFQLHRTEELLGELGRNLADSGPLLRRYAQGRTTWPERLGAAVPPFRSSRRRLSRALDERVVRALEDTNIPNPKKVMNSYPHELSGGMKQRVLIAQALACDPDILIADEPTTSLDVTIQARILDLVAELQERHHAAVLYISHDLAVVRQVSDRVAVMYAGRVIESGPTREILSNPLHPYTRGLLSASDLTGQRRGRLTTIPGTVPELIEPTPSCRFVTRCSSRCDVCWRVNPALAPHGSEHHEVACFLYGNGGLGLTDGKIPRRVAS
jgi:oligopeptide/dipeptide ABC transporter ATP-binding protein